MTANQRIKRTAVPKTKIRQSDIAREAGASIATVDRVLNRRPGVSKHTIKRIHDAVERLKDEQAGSASLPSALRFDFILPGGPNTFWQMIAEGAEAAGQAYADKGVRIRIHPIEGFNPQALADHISTIRRDSHGLAMVALENPMVREAVNGVFEAGIPVVTMVSDLASEKTIGFVGLNNRAAGRTAGYLMGRFLGGRSGKIALFEGSIGLSYRDHQERDMGFNDVLRELFPKLEVAVRRPTHDSHEEAYRATMELLSDGSDIQGIYNVGGGLRGNIQALKERGRGNDMVCIGHELTSHNRQFLIDGTLDAVIDQSPGLQTMEATRLLYDFHANNGLVSTPRAPDIKIYLRENMS